jgi:hypothetical protein
MGALMVKYRKDIIVIALIFIVVILFSLYKYVVLAAFSLVLYFIIQYCEERNKIGKNPFKLLIIVIIFTTVTSYTIREKLFPIIVKLQEIHEWNIPNFKAGGENIHFSAESIIEEPVGLKIKNSYINLTFKVDYDCIDRFVFINYQFGDKADLNKKIAENGLVFVYKTRAWRFGKDFINYQQRSREFRKDMIKKFKR